MADADTMDVSSLLAPWMQQSPFDMSQYGGAGQFGASMLAAAGPTPYKQPFLAALGQGMLAGQKNALANAQARQQLAGTSIGLQQQIALMPFIRQIMSRMSGQPQVATNPTATAPPSGGAPLGAPGPLTGPPGNFVSQYGAQPAAPDANAGASAPNGGAAPAGPSAPWMGPDPFEESQLGALGGMIGMRGAEGMQKDAALRLQYSPGTATSMEFAKSPVAQDMMLLNQANAAGSKEMVQMAMTKLRSDMGVEHIGSMSGIRTYQEPDGSWTTVNPSNGLRVNDRTGASYMPGALQAFGAREGVEAGARRGAELGAETGGGAPGIPSSLPTPVPSASPRPSARPTAPAVSSLTGIQAFQEPNYVPPVLSSAGAVPQRRGSTSPIAVKELQEGQAKDANKTVDELQEKAVEGQTLMAQTAQIRASAAKYPWTGRFADNRANFLSVLQGAGWATADQVKELSAYQDASKISIQLQASATKQLGSREAAQVFTSMGKSIPNLTLSPQGLDKVSAYMEGVARYNQAQALYAQRLRDQGNAAGVNEVENTFIAHSDPSFFILASASPQNRQEFLQAMPAAKRTQFVQRWDAAIKAGLAPRPLDYSGQ